MEELFIKKRQFFILLVDGKIKYDYLKKENFIIIIKLPSDFKKILK